MLNKNTNCYNIELNFKYSTVISTFSKHITIFWIISIHIWQLKCKQRQTNKTKNGKFYRIIKFFWGNPLWNQKLLLLTATARRSCYTLVRPFPTLSYFPFFHKLSLELICATKIKTVLLKQSAVLFSSCQTNIAYIICLNT